MGSVLLISHLWGVIEARRHSGPSERSELSYSRVQFYQFLRAESRAAQFQGGLGILRPLISPSELNFTQLLDLQSIVEQCYTEQNYGVPKNGPGVLWTRNSHCGNILFTLRDLLFYQSGILCRESDSGTHQCCMRSSANFYLRLPLPREGYRGKQLTGEKQFN